VEVATYQAQGAIESGYRPERWGAYREELKFTGKEEDIELGIDYFGARYYHPRLGRWMSPDHPLTIQRLAAARNPYSYVRGHLLSEVDLKGLAGQDPDVRDRNGCVGDDETCGIRREDGGTGKVTIPEVTIVGQVPGDSKPPVADGLHALGYLGERTLRDGRRVDGPGAEPPFDPRGLRRHDRGFRPQYSVVSPGRAEHDQPRAHRRWLCDPRGTAGAQRYRPADVHREAGGDGCPHQQDIQCRDAGGLHPATAEASHPCIPPYCPCFAAGTMVQTPSGPRAIESIEIGELVLSKDAASGKVAPRRVLHRYVTPDTEVMQLELRAAEDEPERITVTPAHPFWVVAKGRVAANALKAGNRLLSASGAPLEVVRGIPSVQRTTVYNLEVEGFHTYFAGLHAAWVHNTCTVYAGRTAPGPFANKSIPLEGPGRDFTKEQFEELMGEPCHSCGTTNYGTVTGYPVIDHQPAVAFNPPGAPFRGYPQCKTCGIIGPGGMGQPHEIRRIQTRKER